MSRPVGIISQKISLSMLVLTDGFFGREMNQFCNEIKPGFWPLFELFDLLRLDLVK